jgi:hypothetical protein
VCAVGPASGEQAGSERSVLCVPACLRVRRFEFEGAARRVLLCACASARAHCQGLAAPTLAASALLSGQRCEGGWLAASVYCVSGGGLCGAARVVPLRAVVCRAAVLGAAAPAAAAAALLRWCAGGSLPPVSSREEASVGVVVWVPKLSPHQQTTLPGAWCMQRSGVCCVVCEGSREGSSVRASECCVCTAVRAGVNTCACVSVHQCQRCCLQWTNVLHGASRCCAPVLLGCLLHRPLGRAGCCGRTLLAAGGTCTLLWPRQGRTCCTRACPCRNTPCRNHLVPPVCSVHPFRCRRSL